MNALNVLRLLQHLHSKRPADLERIQRQGLFAVKLGQLYALRPDFLSEEKCRQLAQLYQHATAVPPRDPHELIARNAEPGFLDHFSHFEDEPFAVASVGQVHRATLTTGEDVVVKLVKDDFAKAFLRDVRTAKRLLRTAMLFRPRLRRVANPVGLLEHLETNTLMELDLRNEITGARLLASIRDELANDFPMPRLAFPRFWPELSNRHVLVAEFIEGPTLDDIARSGDDMWDDLLELFRMHGGFIFGVGTFHGDLHPGNVIKRGDQLVMIDTGSIAQAPAHVRAGLFGFFRHLVRDEHEAAFQELLVMAERPPSERRKQKFLAGIREAYRDFGGQSVGEQSLTRQMMLTVKNSVVAGASFGEDSFPIIRALMYMDGMVLRSHPEVDLISEMGPGIAAFDALLAARGGDGEGIVEAAAASAGLPMPQLIKTNAQAQAGTTRNPAPRPV